MKKKQGICFAVAAAFFAASGFSGLALAVDELETDIKVNQNTPIGPAAQELIFDSEGKATVNGSVGKPWPSLRTSTDTVDFYRFQARDGDVVEVDIDGGIKLPAGTSDSIDTSVYILGPAKNTLFAIITEGLVSSTLDEGTVDLREAHIGPYAIPLNKEAICTGTCTYYIAVTGHPRRVTDGGGVINPGGDMRLAAGTYTLNVSRISQTLHISMEIKPGSGLTYPPVNPKAKGSLPVALLSSDKFDALTVEPSSLTFGRTGIETSWLRCAKEGTDVNGDGLLDLVCHFDNFIADFQPETRQAMLKGKLKSSGAAGLSATSASGMDIEGSADLKIRSK